MKRNRTIFLILCICLSVLSAGCGTKTEGDDKQKSGTASEKPPEKEPHEKEPPEKEPPAYEPSDAETASYALAWINEEYTEEGEDIRTRLILEENGDAQLVVQNGIGILLRLSAGKWRVSGEGKIALDLTTESSGEEEPGEDGCLPVAGEYTAVLKGDGAMALGCLEGAAPLTPAQKDGSVIFYEDNAPEGYTPLEYRLRIAALKYYAETYGGEYPGEAEIESAGPDGVLVRLYEDMEGHIATSALYLIDPSDFHGTDEITGAEIDFSPYIK